MPHNRHSGNLSPIKGAEFLIEAAPMIKQGFPTAKFIIVGELLKNREPYWSSLMRRSQELGLGNDVIFAGRRNDIPQVMAALTLYVHPSEMEAAPMSVLEASATGLPVVASDVGGLREVVDDGTTGFLVASRSPSRIAEAVIRLLESAELARSMGRNAVERMRKLFSIEACVEKHSEVYTAALHH